MNRFTVVYRFPLLENGAGDARTLLLDGVNKIAETAMNHKLVNDNSFSHLIMSSQESGVMSDGTFSQIVRDVQDVFPCSMEILFNNTEPFEEKYDISQPMQEQIQVSPEPPPPPQVQMPTNEEFAGSYDFQVVPDQQDDTKSWVYSQKLKKVFIEMEKTLPIRIKWTPMFSGLYVRAVMAFCQSAHRSEAVTRCHNHIALSNPESAYLHHVLSCRHTQAIYRNTNGHYSVVVPLGTPQTGSDYVQMDLTFHCKNSCSTGINRRPTEVVFSLETASGEVVGRRKLSVRICSCPKRDKDKEERSVREYSAPKKRKLATGKKCHPVYREPDPDSEVFDFPFLIYGRENLETLKKVARGLMSESLQRGGPATVIRPLIDDMFR